MLDDGLIQRFGFRGELDHVQMVPSSVDRLDIS